MTTIPVNRVWNVGSRWSGAEGTPESTILDIFIKNSVAFINPEGRDLSSIQIDDFIAITDGKKIVAVAKAASEAQKISEMSGVYLSESDQQKIDSRYQDVVGVKIHFYPGTLLQSSQFIPYASRKRFCRINDADTIDRVSAVWSAADVRADRDPFNIEARTATLADLLKDRITRLYMIPIFQRPYSWGELEVERFLRDALSAYRKQESMFIGTMQFSAKRILSTRGEWFREVIDGQQRLTTCALILKSLLMLRPENAQLRSLVRNFDWIESKVSGGEQQKALDAAIHSECIDQASENGMNRFADNYHQILSTLKDAASEQGAGDAEGDESIPVDLDGFGDHFANCLQFVVIETDAGLSRTIQIFNVINTTGLDLNGGDIFKVRAFEYFTEIHGQPSSCFADISAIYESIDRTNASHRRAVTSIQEILGIYQKVIVARHNLPFALTRTNTETFYERLFDSLLKIKSWDEYKKTVPLDRDKNGVPLLDLRDLRKLLDCRLSADQAWHVCGAMEWETRLAHHLIKRSRYSSYWTLALLVDYCYAQETREGPKLRDRFVQALAKLCVVYSIVNAKQIYEIHTFFARLSKKMFEHGGAEPARKATLEEIIAELHEKFMNKHQGFREALSQNLAGYATAKNLICRLLEALHAKDPKGLEAIFEGGYDIEHIQASNDEDLSKREQIWQTWGELLNSIGNLMLLEFDMNRSIKNQRFSSKKIHYSQSRFAIARQIAKTSGTEWTTESAQQKLDRDSKTLDQFLFTMDSSPS